jgi:hypothetical protein
MCEFFRVFRLLRRVEEDPGTRVGRIAAAQGIGAPPIWRILHEQALYSFHI